MAIRILLDHGVPQNHIVLVTMLVAAGGGICVLRKAFPQVNYVCGSVDGEMQERRVQGRTVWVMTPGMGMIGMSGSL